MKVPRFIALGFPIAALAVACTDLAGPEPNRTDTPQLSVASGSSLDPGIEGTATDVNADTTVVGRSDGAFKWSPAMGVTALAPTAWSSAASAINDNGQIVGQVQGTNSAPVRAARWSADGVLEILANLPGGIEAQGFGLNNHGMAVGVADLPFNGDIAAHAALWDASGAVTDLQTLGGLSSEAVDINDDNVVVGSSSDAAYNFRAFVWTHAAGMQPLPTPFGGSSWAIAINNSGQIVGGMTVTGGETHAVLWQPAGQVVDLGTLGGTFSQAHDIDELGRVVGESRDANGDTRAFVWTETDGMTDLAGTSAVAGAISESGIVVGRSPAFGFSSVTLWTLEQEATAIELSLSRVSVTPVVARCFNAVSQVAETFVGRYRCEMAPNRVPVARTDSTTGTITMMSGSTPVPGADVVVRVAPVDSSGSHLHDIGSRPTGRFLTEQGLENEITVQTDSLGRAIFRYQTSGVSGEEDLIVELVDDPEVIADTARISIGFDLVRMARSGPLTGDSSGVATYTYVQDPTGGHGLDTDNGINPFAESVILEIFNRYVEEYGGAGFQDDGRTPNNGVAFVITEASLPRGGLFDVGPEVPDQRPSWRNPHQFHRTGLDFDVRLSNIPESHRRLFLETCNDVEGTLGAECRAEGNHFHVYVDYTRRLREGFING
ncbi:MAG: DUF3466 family protein [Gemmatimonadota bacterium]|jgi:probable HAF family extracellular repeat protein